jgi:hypothetical protein
VPHRKWKFRIRHILEAIEKINSYTRGMDLQTFAADHRTVDAVLRNFIIVGEAVAQIPREVRDAHLAVPWALMSGMRNVLVHDYDRIRADVVWMTIQHDLPGLVPLLEHVLSDAIE